MNSFKPQGSSLGHFPSLCSLARTSQDLSANLVVCSCPLRLLCLPHVCSFPKSTELVWLRLSPCRLIFLHPALQHCKSSVPWLLVIPSVPQFLCLLSHMDWTLNSVFKFSAACWLSEYLAVSWAFKKPCYNEVLLPPKTCIPLFQWLMQTIDRHPHSQIQILSPRVISYFWVLSG